MDYLKQTRQWVEHFVIALNLCPFAAVPFRKDRIRFVLASGTDPDDLARTFLKELNYLYQIDAETTETTLIVHPNVLTDFLDYNDFLGVVDELLEASGLVGIIQVASFHPDYEFADGPAGDPANYTNRSPFPMLHLIREASISRAVEHYPEPEQIPVINTAKLRAMGMDKVKNYWKK